MCAVVAESADGAFDGVALLVGDLVEGRGRPPLLLRALWLWIWSAGSGMVALILRRRRSARVALLESGLVARQSAGAGPWGAPTSAADADPIHNVGVSEVVVALPGVGARDIGLQWESAVTCILPGQPTPDRPTLADPQPRHRITCESIQHPVWPGAPAPSHAR
jgi:hypothetical protein